MNADSTALVIVYSYHHNSTQKVAEVIAHTLGAAIKHPNEVSPETIPQYHLLGLGAGIDSGKHYAPLLAFAQSLPVVQNTAAFIFSTCGVYGKAKMGRDHQALRNILQRKGFTILDEFSCLGFNTNSFLKFLGGINQGKPDAADLQRAVDFARNLTVPIS